MEELEWSANSLKRFSASFSETGFGGPRTLTNGCVSVRGPPVCVSENDNVFGFSFFTFLGISIRVEPKILGPLIRKDILAVHSLAHEGGL